MQAEPIAYATPTQAKTPASTVILRWVDQYRAWLFAIVVLIYIAGFNGQWHINSDTAIYANIARNIVEGRGYDHPLNYHNAVSPGTPYLVAVCFRLFGSDTLLSAHILFWLMSLFALGLFYHLVKLHLDRSTAVVTTIILALTERFYRYGFEVMAELLFLVGTLLFLIGYEAIWKRRYNMLINGALLIAGTAIMAMFRSVVLVFFAALVLTMLWHIARGPHRLRFVTVTAMTILVMLVVRYFDPRTTAATELIADETMALRSLQQPIDMLRRMVTVNLLDLFEESTPDAIFGTELGPGINTIASLAAIGCGLMLARRRPLWGALVAGFVLQQLMFPHVTARYYVPILPLLVLGWWLAVRAINLALPGVKGGFALVAMLCLWMLPNLAYVGKDIYIQHRGEFIQVWKDGRYAGLPEMGQRVNNRVGPSALILVSDKELHEPFHHFSRRVTRLASKKTIEKRLPHGTPIFFLSRGSKEDTRRLRMLRRNGYEIENPILRTPIPGDDARWTLHRVKPKDQSTTRPATKRAG